MLYRLVVVFSVHFDLFVPVERVDIRIRGCGIERTGNGNAVGTGRAAFGPDGQPAQEYETEGQDQYDADDEPGQGVPVGAQHQVRRSFDHDHSDVGLGATGPVLQLARVTAAVLGDDRHDGEVRVPALGDEHAAARLRQRPVVARPPGRRYGHAVHATRHGGVVALGDHYDGRHRCGVRFAREVVQVELVPRGLGQPDWRLADGRRAVRHVPPGHPLAQRSQLARTVPRVVVQLDAVQTGQRHDRGRFDLAQLIVVQTEPFQRVLQPGERGGLEQRHPAPGHVQPDQPRDPSERAVWHPHDRVVVELELPEFGHRLEHGRRHHRYAVVAQVQLDQVVELAERVPVQRLDPALGQVQLLQVEQVGVRERVLAQPVQRVVGEVEQLRAVVQVPRHGRHVGRRADGRLLATAPLALARRWTVGPRAVHSARRQHQKHSDQSAAGHRRRRRRRR